MVKKFLVLFFSIFLSVWSYGFCMNPTEEFYKPLYDAIQKKESVEEIKKMAAKTPLKASRIYQLLSTLIHANKTALYWTLHYDDIEGAKYLLDAGIPGWSALPDSASIALILSKHPELKKKLSKYLVRFKFTPFLEGQEGGGRSAVDELEYQQGLVVDGDRGRAFKMLINLIKKANEKYDEASEMFAKNKITEEDYRAITKKLCEFEANISDGTKKILGKLRLPVSSTIAEREKKRTEAESSLDKTAMLRNSLEKLKSMLEALQKALVS